MNSRNKALDVVAVMNLDCNFDCVYCYEGDLKGDRYMSARTADDLVAFVKQRLTPDKNKLIVDFYGGEPLLSADRIESLSRKLKASAEAIGVEYRFALVTNGSLLKRRLVERLAPLGLQSAKVTLDGPAEVHDQYRPFKSVPEALMSS